ncbi:MAG: hypothetical protein LBC30_03975 [Puniceicoccales bacterium]|nr:hypothetical protein [Puniceicoccales bacterium]
MSQIHGYLEVKNFVCRFSELNEENISGLKENVFVFLLKEAEPISHIFLLRRKGKDYFQTIDTVGEVKMRTFDEIKNWKHFGLFVANDEKKLPQEKSFFEKHVLSASLCLAGLFFLVFSIKNWRKRDETKA